MPNNSTRAHWLRHLTSTEPADRPNTEAAVGAIYPQIHKLPAPRHYFWFDSPAEAGWAVKLLSAPADGVWGAFVENKCTTHDGRIFVENLRNQLSQQAGLEWNELISVTGMNRSQQTSFNLERLEVHGVKDLFLSHPAQDDPRRAEYNRRVRPIFGDGDPNDPLRLIEGPFQTALHRSAGWDLSLFHNRYNGSHYTFAKMALDAEEAAVSGRPVPAPLAAIWEVAQNVAICWLFKNAAVFLERPAELHFDESMRLHCPDAPAVVFRDGSTAWCWNGVAYSESTFLKPEAIKKDQWKSLPADLASHLKKKLPQSATSPAGAKGKLANNNSIINSKLPVVHAARLDALCQLNKGRLPLLDRYLAGEHEAVWRDLVALGDAVRDNTYAADALAVAYETMDRVNHNVRLISERLTAAGLKKTNEFPLHMPPDSDAPAMVRRLEKATGAVPLSLRAFYEVVGAVDWIGEHPHLSAAQRTVCTDPLVVLPLAVALEEAEASEGWIVIAPDELHKADTSGGGPYSIEVPDASADALLKCECHGLLFVEYLRLSLRYGGFPGFENFEFKPAELAGLTVGLRAF